MRLSWPSSLRAVGAEPRRPFACETRERDVHVVGRAAHEANRRLGDAHQNLVPALQIVLRPRDHVADVDGLAGLGVGHQTVVGIFVLPVEDRGQLVGRAGERRVVDDVVDPLVPEPHLSLPGLETLQELLTRAGAHCLVPTQRGRRGFARHHATRHRNRLGLVRPEPLVVGRVLECLL